MRGAPSLDLHTLSLPELQGLDNALQSAIAARRQRPFSGSATPKRSDPMGKTTKADVIDFVSAARGMTKKDTAAVLDEALALIRRHVEMGQTVTLTGFGAFAPRHRKARTGRNPQTGAPVEIAASTVMGFRPAKPGKGRA